MVFGLVVKYLTAPFVLQQRVIGLSLSILGRKRIHFVKGIKLDELLPGFPIKGTQLDQYELATAL